MCGCGEKVEVESMLAVGDLICPHCGRFVVGERRPPSADPTQDSSAAPTEQPPASSAGGGLAIGALAIVNFLGGAIHLCRGAVTGCAFDYAQGPQGAELVRQHALKPDQFEQISQMGSFLSILVGCQ
jgi:hypothetical protein